MPRKRILLITKIKVVASGHENKRFAELQTHTDGCQREEGHRQPDAAQQPICIHCEYEEILVDQRIHQPGCVVEQHGCEGRRVELLRRSVRSEL